MIYFLLHLSFVGINDFGIYPGPNTLLKSKTDVPFQIEEQTMDGLALICGAIVAQFEL